MALLAIKPSRGTVGFFALLIAGLVGRSCWRTHETQLVVRDLPYSHATRRLLRCVLGRDAMRVLGPRPPEPAPSHAPWDTAVTDRLRQSVRANWSPEWPARCVPIADRLANRLEGASDARRAWYPAREVARLLGEASSNPTTAVQRVEDGSLPQQLVNLALLVSAISDGAEEGWESQLAPAPTDLFPVRLDEPPTATPLPNGAAYLTLAMPDLVLAQDGADGRLHAITFAGDATGGVDRAIGQGAPVGGDSREGATRVVDDRGDSVFLPGGEPAQLVRMPDAIGTGREALDGEWQVVLAGESLWLLANDGGTLRLRATPRQGEVRWSDAPLASIGAPDTFLGALVLPASEPDGVRIAAIRRGAVGLSVDGYTVTPAPVADAATPLPATTTPATTTTPTAPLAVVGPAESLVGEWPAFDAHLVSCAAGASLRYALVRADDGMSVLVFDGRTVERLYLAYGESGAPIAPDRLEFTCNDSGALVFGDFAGRYGTLVYFDRASRAGRVIDPPRFGHAPVLVGGALLGGGAVVALVDNGATLRAWRNEQPAVAGSAWDGGTLLALQHPLPPPTRPPAPEPPDVDATRLVAIEATSAHADQVAVLARVTIGTHEYVGRIASHDRGATWR